MGLSIDAWLSEELGKPVHRLVGEAPEEIPLGLTYIRVPAQDLELVWQLQDMGFRIVNTTVTFEAPVPLPAPEQTAALCRMAEQRDEDAVAQIARDSFTYDRFHCDKGISRDVADQVKDDWVRNFFAGKRGKWMIVAEVDGVVSGFLLLLEGQGRTVIDLVAVSDGHRGARIAGGMISFAASTIEGLKTILVGTQVDNVPSVRMYEALGFRLVGSEHVLHCHR